jgi:cytochrome c-type biogenesis protein CcsB
MAFYTAEYAFGRKGRVAATAAEPGARPARARELVGAAVGAGGASIPALDAEPEAPEPAAGRAGASSTASAATGTTASDVPSAAGPPARGRDMAARFGMIALVITGAGAVLHLSSLTMRAVAVDRAPWGNMYEFATAAGFVAVLAFLAIVWRMPQIRYLGGFALLPVVILMFLAGTVWYVRAAPLVPALQSYWLAIHVSAAACSEGVLMTSSVLTALYLVRARHDRRVALAAAAPAAGADRTPAPAPRAGLGAKLPTAAALDKAAYRAAAFAFPIYTFGVIAGAIWAEAAWGRYWGWDPKEVWAFIVWVLFAAYLHARATAGWRGRAAAWINLLGFAAMTVNFFVVNVVISGLHSYSGL